jgi:ABC-type multidrug transport system fused ATPase/permease subunit
MSEGPANLVLESYSNLERDSRRRRDTDARLSYGLYLLLGIVTFGIYILYVHWKLIERQQAHFKRMVRFNDDLLTVVQEVAETKGLQQTYAAQIEHLHLVNEDFGKLQRGKERSAALWIVLSIITLGIAFLYVLYFLNSDLVAHQRAETEYVEEASGLLNQLGVGKYRVSLDADVPNHSYPLFLFLTIITLTIFELYWAYVRIKDPNDHFDEHERWEDQLLGTIRSAT